MTFRIFSNLEVALNEIPSTRERLEWLSELEWYVMYGMWYWYVLTLLHTFINFNDLDRKFHMDGSECGKGRFWGTAGWGREEVWTFLQRMFVLVTLRRVHKQHTNAPQQANTEMRVVETCHCLPPSNNSSWSQTWPAPFCLEGPPLYSSSFFSQSND